jgi:hypothetical protein
MGFTGNAVRAAEVVRSAQIGGGWAMHQYRGWSGVGRKVTGVPRAFRCLAALNEESAT